MCSLRSSKLTAIIFFALLVPLIASCAKTPAPPKPDAQKKAAHNKALLSFDPKAVSDLIIIANDPLNPTPWSARLKRIEPGPYQAAAWQIISGPNDMPLIDRQADEIFIFHLLDSLRELKVLQQSTGAAPGAGTGAPAQTGPLGSLGPLGLDPPKFLVRFDSTEIRIGDGIPHSKGAYAMLQGSTPIQVDGSFLQLLTHLRSFEDIRRRQLLAISADDVDEIEVNKNSRKVLFAQREAQSSGDDWIGTRGRKLKVRVTAFLESLTALRIHRFFDQPKLPSQRSPLYKIILKDRRARTTTITFMDQTNDNKLWAITSSRPGAVFEFTQATKQIFEILNR